MVFFFSFSFIGIYLMFLLTNLAFNIFSILNIQMYVAICLMTQSIRHLFIENSHRITPIK